MVDWCVLGSAPSAPIHLFPFLEANPNVKIACVNGSYAILPDGRLPDVYGCFEKDAIRHYKSEGVFARFREAEIEIFCHHKYGSRVLGATFEYTPIANDFVYERGMLLWPFGGAMGRPIGMGSGLGLGMGAATLMTLAIAELKTPPNLHCFGIDGYDVNAVHSSLNDTKPDMSMPDAKTCRDSNRCSSAHIGHITNLERFKEINFIWHGEPRHPHQDLWNVSYESEPICPSQGIKS